MKAAQRITLGNLGIRWHYWLVPVMFAGVGALLTSVSVPGLLVSHQDKTVGGFFVVASIFGFLWPFLRQREKFTASIRTLRSKAGEHKGLFIPTSKIQRRMALGMGTTIGICGLLAWIWSDDLAVRIEGAAVFILYVIFTSVWLLKASKGECGILLTKEGVLWHEMLLSPSFIPWEDIAAWYVYEHKDTPLATRGLSLGVRLTEAALARMSQSDRHGLNENFQKFGAHLYYKAETLLVPLQELEKTGNYYRQHPEARTELDCETALLRLESSLVNNNVIQPV